MVYDLQGEYPNLPRRHNQTQHTQQPSNNNPTNVSPEQTTPVQPAQPAANTASLEQLKAEMQAEFRNMIKNEVKTQIKTQMEGIQADVANLGLKIDTMQASIRDSIGSTIRESMQANFKPTGANSSHQQQQSHYPRQAPRPSVHNLHSIQNNYASPASAMNYSTPNYYEPIQPTGQQQDTPMQNTFDPNISNQSDTLASRSTTEGTSPMETGAQQ
jgi:hypothetical protein